MGETLASTPSPLAGYRVFASKDGDELRSFLSAKGLGVEFPSHGASTSLDATINAAYLPGSYVSFLFYGPAVELKAEGNRPDFSLSMPHTGGFDATIGRRSVRGGGNNATLGSPGFDQRTHMPAGATRYGISLSQGTVAVQLEALLGHHLGEALEFAPQIPLDTAAGRSLRATVDYVVMELERVRAHTPGCEGDRLFRAELEQLLITRLLTGHAHNYADKLNRRRTDTAPCAVRRVVDYLQAHPENPVTLAQLVGVAGVPGRTLRAQFSRSLGMSPMAYVRGVRLARVRAELCTGTPGTDITTVATRWGFTHLSRFANQYRCVYGELPSETLARTMH